LFGAAASLIGHKVNVCVSIQIDKILKLFIERFNKVEGAISDCGSAFGLKNLPAID